MRLILTTLASTALLLAAPGLISDAFAHGGAYRGPAGEVPPDSREPSDPPPPPEGGGPTTPGGEPTGGPTTGGGNVGGPTTGGDGGGGPTTGGGGAGPASGGGGPSGPKTGGPKRPSGGARGPGFEDWTFWWNFNKDDILQLKSAIKKSSAGTGTAVHAFGKKKTTGEQVKTATDAAIWNDIVPALQKMLEEKDLNFDIQSAAALALAKIGDKSIVPTLKKMATNDRKDGYHLIVEESAALAFGLLQDDSPDNITFLIDLVEDQDRNSSKVRPFAAVSLGLLGSKNESADRVQECLLKVLAGKETKPDVKPASLLALGLLGNTSVVPELVKMVETGKAEYLVDGKAKKSDDLNDIEVAFAVQALGKIGAPGLGDNPTKVVDLMVDLLDGGGRKKVDTNVRRSAAIALGQLAPSCEVAKQGEILKALTKTAEDGGDASERNFAMIALGRMAGTEGISTDTRNDVVKSLRKFLDKGKPANLAQPFAALAMGLVGREMSANEEDIRKPLRKKFDDASKGDPRARGAYGIASGLVKDKLAVEALVDVLKDRGADKRLRGYTAVALGMIQDSNSRQAIRDALSDDSDRDLRVQTAIAAGLMGDAEVIGDLVKILESGEDSQYVLGSVALALGQIGDERAIAPLLKISADADKKFPDITRALATVALGQIGDRRDVPVLARVARDINFRAIGGVPALTELLTIL